MLYSGSYDILLNIVNLTIDLSLELAQRPGGPTRDNGLSRWKTFTRVPRTWVQAYYNETKIEKRARKRKREREMEKKLRKGVSNRGEEARFDARAFANTSLCAECVFNCPFN